MTPWTVASLFPLSMGFFKARIMKWVAISFSRGSSWSRDQTHILQVSCTASGFFLSFSFFYTTEPPGEPPKFLSVLFPMSLQYKGQDTFGAAPSLVFWFACFMHHSGFTASQFVHMFSLTIYFTFPLHWSLFPLSFILTAHKPASILLTETILSSRKEPPAVSTAAPFLAAPTPPGRAEWFTAHREASQTFWDESSSLPQTVLFGKLLNLYVSQLLHILKGGDNSIYFTVLLWALNKLYMYTFGTVPGI